MEERDNLLDIPFVDHPGHRGCALASYTMIAKYYFPEVTFEEIANVCKWQPGKGVWPFRFWLWIMDREISVVDYDTIDYEAWAAEGIEGLRKSIPPEEYAYLTRGGNNLDAHRENIARVFAHENFSYVRRKPTFADLEHRAASGGVCEVVLNSKALDGDAGLSMHRVPVLSVSGNEIVFHDQRVKTPHPNRREKKEAFVHAWLETLDEPELCVYRRARF